jgi:hypothetical protein
MGSLRDVFISRLALKGKNKFCVKVCLSSSKLNKLVLRAFEVLDIRTVSRASHK